jgi:transcriptional regulator with XRE-family HTH domain
MPKRPRTPGDFDHQYEQLLSTVGARIREARLKAGLTQAELGARADLKQSYIFELESGTANITLRTLARMADVLEIDARDFLPESRSSPLSLPRIERLHAALIAVEKHQSEAAELATELRGLADLRLALEAALKSVQAPAPGGSPDQGNTPSGEPDPSSR